MLALYGTITLAHLCLLIFMTVMMLFCQGFAIRIHQKIFPKMTDKDLQNFYFKYLGYYKLLWLVFFAVPCLTIYLMTIFKIKI